MKRGLCGYAELVARLTAQPSTVAEMHRDFGVTESHARRVPRSLLDLGVLSVVEWRREKPKGPPQRVFGVARVPPVRQDMPTRSGRPSKHCGAKPRTLYLRAEMIAFAAAWDALLDPMTAREIAEETGIGVRTVWPLMKTLHELGLIGVAGWTRKRQAGPYSAQYRRGVRRDASKPQRISRGALLTRYRQRVTERRMNDLLAGTERLAA